MKKSYKVRKAADKHLLKRIPAPGTQTDLLWQAGAPAYARAVVSDEGRINIQYHDARGRFFSGGESVVALIPDMSRQQILNLACMQHDFRYVWSSHCQHRSCASLGAQSYAFLGGRW